MKDDQARQSSPVSIPNGKPGPLRLIGVQIGVNNQRRFNPKREARPSQTRFESGTYRLSITVSIPNGKPGPLRLSRSLYGHRRAGSFNPKREARPSQTTTGNHLTEKSESFNPKREARPSQTQLAIRCISKAAEFQSQTGSQALSDV